MLASGIAILLLCGELYWELANFVEEFGGIHWSWGLVERYPHWFVLVAFGLWLVTAASLAFIRERRRNSN